MKRCPHCGRNSPRDAGVCGGCGNAFAYSAPRHAVDPSALPRPVQTVAPAPHDVSCAILASMFVIGAGQMYNQQSAKGAALFAASALALALTIWLWSGVWLLIMIVIWTVSMLDAAFIAGRVKEQEQVTSWQWF